MPKLVAVYGSLRKGLGNHRVIEGSEQLGTDVVKGWEMFSLGGFPGIKTGSGDIVVEVYKVVSEGIARNLDRLEGFSEQDSARNFYNKATISTAFGEAEIYTLEEGYHGDSVPDGDWAKYRHNARG